MTNKAKTIDEVRKVLTKFNFSSLHDYDNKGDHIEMLGAFDDTIEYLREFISEEWEFILKRKNEENGFCRIDIVRKQRS